MLGKYKREFDNDKKNMKKLLDLALYYETVMARFDVKHYDDAIKLYEECTDLKEREESLRRI